MKKIFSTLIFATLAFAAIPMQANVGDVDIYELSLTDNLEVPAVKKDLSQKVQEYQYELAVNLITKHNLNVETLRNNEVIVVSVTADKLFAPNDTVLLANGKNQLKPLLPLLKNQGFYKMLIVMHSDDTGSEQYTRQLTNSRVNAVYDWIEENESVDFVVPYALGAKEPIVENNSMTNRNLNRRLEIYLVPGEAMLAQLDNKSKTKKVKKKK